MCVCVCAGARVCVFLMARTCARAKTRLIKSISFVSNFFSLLIKRVNYGPGQRSRARLCARASSRPDPDVILQHVSEVYNTTMASIKQASIFI